MNNFLITHFLCIFLASDALCLGANSEVKNALKNGNINDYHAQITERINRRISDHFKNSTKQSLLHLLDEPELRRILAQRQIIGKIGAASIDGFAKGNAQRKIFLGNFFTNFPKGVILQGTFG